MPVSRGQEHGAENAKGRRPDCRGSTIALGALAGRAGSTKIMAMFRNLLVRFEPIRPFLPGIFVITFGIGGAIDSSAPCPGPTGWNATIAGEKSGSWTFHNSMPQRSTESLFLFFGLVIFHNSQQPFRGEVPQIWTFRLGGGNNFFDNGS